MDLSIKTYRVQENDTLESVAQQFNLTSEELKRYHNIYCELNQLIGFSINGIHEIYIPPIKQINELNQVRKLNQDLKVIPNHLTTDFYASSYSVNERLEQDGKENINIDYLISVQLVEDIKRGFNLQIETSNFLKNKEIVEDKISTISQACLKSISPILFEIPAQGKIRGLVQYKELIKRFQDKKQALKESFIGDFFEDYLNKFDKVLHHENYLLYQLCSSVLYQFLFPKMSWLNQKIEWQEKMYFIKNSVAVDCLFKTSYNFENEREVEIIIEGYVKNPQDLKRLLQERNLDKLCEDEYKENETTSEIILHYHLDRKTKQLNKIQTTIHFANKNSYYKHHLTVGKNEEMKQKFSTLA